MQNDDLKTYIEEEIDLSEIFSKIWKNKFFIMSLSLIVTSIALLYVLAQPNIYVSKSILIPKDQGSQPSLGGAAAIAAMAGINLGGGRGDIDIATLFQNLLNDYSFNKPLIVKYNINQLLQPKTIEKDLVFAPNGIELYYFFQSFFKGEKNKSYEETIFDTFRKLKNILSVSKDKKSGGITLSAQFTDRFITKKLVEIYLMEMSNYIKKLDLKEIDDQVHYYEQELQRAKSLDLKENINQLLSTLVKKKVLSQAGEFYMVKQLTKPQVAYIKDKAGPKRALIVIVAFITSIILGIFIVLLKEFLKKDESFSTQNEDERYKFLNE